MKKKQKQKQKQKQPTLKKQFNFELWNSRIPLIGDFLFFIISIWNSIPPKFKND
jgi:hypothetical protein